MATSVSTVERLIDRAVEIGQSIGEYNRCATRLEIVSAINEFEGDWTCHVPHEIVDLWDDLPIEAKLIAFIYAVDAGYPGLDIER